MASTRPILKNQAVQEPKREILGKDLSALISRRDILMEMHGFDWKHPRILAYLERCGVPNRHFLSEAHMKNLVEKLESLPIPNYDQKKAS
ncbi:hypothetical protein [Pseudanabaena sp. 'Roaring Creek']|uniref:hypothetical protein n=1 Tax=Pseudanabaena sp. 'Roaring Creek' TaxID=1681830 RepID=UPI0006D7B4F8|nr:hypothetical protein [Pseudanabaena sp. 'Roaring Creek']